VLVRRRYRKLEDLVDARGEHGITKLLGDAGLFLYNARRSGATSTDAPSWSIWAGQSGQ